ncbi:putative major tail V domain protein [Escherichia coli MP021552.7]|nr:putative major tail V domain protein [Escherichia coli MP021552.7]
MSTPNPLEKTKGAGTTFWMYTGLGIRLRLHCQTRTGCDWQW